MEKKILVIGATGNIGKEIVKLLKTKNANFVAGTTKLQVIEGVETIQLDLADKNSLVKAMKGITTLFMLLPSHQDLVQFGDNLIDAAKISGINYTITAPSAFMQNFSTSMLSSYNAGAIYNSLGNGKLAWVDTRDIAAINIEVLLNPEKYVGQALKITGSEVFSYEEAVNRMNKILGKETQYIDIPHEAASKAMKDMFFPDFIVDLLISLNEGIKQGHFLESTDTIEKITG